jgi:uncharacterized protein (DUF1810 family)
MSRLERFKSAQRSSHSGFQSALAEIRSGGKRGHWIWYVFPQLRGLGTSAPSQSFAIDGVEEATEFLHDTELRRHLLIIATALAEQLRTREATSLSALMGSDIDARKVVSSLTLFGHVARNLAAAEGTGAYDAIARVAEDVLAVAASEGYPPCAFTLRRISSRAGQGAIAPIRIDDGKAGSN